MAKQENPLAHRDYAIRFLADLQHSVATPKVHYWRGSYWLYEGGRWKEYDGKTMSLIVLGWLSDPEVGISACHRTAESVTQMLAALTRIEGEIKPPCWYPPMPGTAGNYWLPMQNLLVNPERLALGLADATRPRTGRWFSQTVLPYNWDSQATCPLFDDYLSRQFEGDSERIQLCWEWLGYLTRPDTSLHAAMFLVGEAGTGKSTLMQVVEMLLGSEACGKLPVEDLSKNFALVSLEGKLVNLVDEVGEITRHVEHILKWWVSGQSITVDRKYKERYTLVPTARLMMGVNNWPEFNDMSGGIWRRIQVLPMPVLVPPEQRVRDYASRFEPELPGIFNKAMLGLGRMLTNGRFSACQAGFAEKKFHQDSRQNHRSFVSECLVASDSGFIPTPRLESLYKSWCQLNGLTVTASLYDVQREIKRQYPTVELSARRYSDGQRRRGVAGVTLRSDELTD